MRTEESIDCSSSMRASWLQPKMHFLQNVTGHYIQTGFNLGGSTVRDKEMSLDNALKDFSKKTEK